MREVALVFDTEGYPIYWHEPPDASTVALPDSRALWDVLWEHRAHLGGVAHTHPGGGIPVPSHTDLTTWAAVEVGLGRRLLWPILSDQVAPWYVWRGPGPLDYVFETYWVGELATARARLPYGELLRRSGLA